MYIKQKIPNIFSKITFQLAFTMFQQRLVQMDPMQLQREAIVYDHIKYRSNSTFTILFFLQNFSGTFSTSSEPLSEPWVHIHKATRPSTRPTFTSTASAWSLFT